MTPKRLWSYLAILIISVPWIVSVSYLHLWGQIHHFYFGLLIVLLVPERWKWSTLLWILGLGIMLDDSVQHVIQCTNPAYLSPLHVLYNSVYIHLPKWLQHLLDKI